MLHASILFFPEILAGKSDILEYNWSKIEWNVLFIKSRKDQVNNEKLSDETFVHKTSKITRFVKTSKKILTRHFIHKNQQNNNICKNNRKNFNKMSHPNINQ
jgi:hypothetical protein